MTCLCAPALILLRDQLNRAFPHRNTASDGCCGDSTHQHSVSDHNPDVRGYAHALDITTDPALGMDGLAERLLHDPRCKYVIWNGRIANPVLSNGLWRPYDGPDPHRSHIHLSILKTATFDGRAWPIVEEDMYTDTDRANAQQVHEAVARLDTWHDEAEKRLVSMEEKIDRLVNRP